MRRTTVYLPTDLVDGAKAKALVVGTSLTGLIRDGLGLMLGLEGGGRRGQEKGKKFKFGGYRMGKMKPFNRRGLYEEIGRHRVRGL